MSSIWYDWMHAVKICPKCGWSGLGSEAKSGESFDSGVDKHCPACDHRFGYVSYPLLQESIDDARAPVDDKLIARVALQMIAERDKDKKG